MIHAAPGLPRPPLERRRWLVGCALTAIAVAVLLVAFGPAPGDANVHLYRTFLVRHGALVWDNYWYEGNFPLASYSLLYYLPAALVGNLVLVLGAVVASTLLFASIAHREWGEAARWPGRVFAVFAATPLFTGLYSYALGFTMLLATLRALQARRGWLAVLLAALTLGCSPLAFAFLGLILLAVLAARRRLSAPALALGAGMVLLAGFELAVLRLFPTGGIYPFHLINLAGVLEVCVVGALLARRAQRGAPLLMFFVLWGATSIVASFAATPVGGNWTRLGEVVFPVMLLTAALARFRPRGLVAFALLSALVYALVPSLLLIPYRLDNRPASQAFWQPALQFLARHERPGFRVEVVPTAAHWESYWIPRAGFALARGWYRQLDIVDNPVLYSKQLDPASYERWLRSAAVEYVLLPATTLDPIGGAREAAILRSGAAGLPRVFHDRNWTIYRLERPTPLITGPAPVQVAAFSHTRIGGTLARPGRYLLRVHFNPFWNDSANICAVRAPGDMTWLDASSAGAFSLKTASVPQVLLRTVLDHDSCTATTHPAPRSART